jgi:HK97 family phage major capsid protein
MKLRSCETKSLARAHAEFHSPKVLAASAFRIVGMFAPVLAVAVIALFGLSAYADAGVAHSGHHIGITTFAMAGMVGGKSNITALRQKKIELGAAQRKLLDGAAKEDRVLNETEAATFDDNIKVLTSLEQQIVREEHVLQLERGTPGTEDDDQRAAAAAGAGNQKQGFKTLGEQLVAVATAARTDSRNVDPRLIQAAASGASETVPSDGGFLVQKDFSSEILKRTYSLGEILTRVNRKPVSGNGLKINGIDETSRVDGSRYGGVQAFWANEADTVTAKKPKFRQIDLNLNKLFAIYYATDELLQDAPALGEFATEAFTEELNFKAEDAIFEGDGSGKPLGFMNSNALITVAKETSQPNTTVVAENVLKMFSRMWPRSRKNAAWFVNSDVLPQLPQLNVKIKNVAGTENVGGIATPIYQMPSGPDSSGTILGLPVIPVEYASTLGVKGDIVLADLSQYLLIDKGGMQSAASMHVRFLNDEMCFRVTYRVDGQPTWNKDLTPFKGTNTLSPFVTLAARP